MLWANISVDWRMSKDCTIGKSSLLTEYFWVIFGRCDRFPGV